MVTCSQLLFFFLIYYTLATFSTECAASFKKQCNTGKFCFWMFAHISSLYLIYILDYFKTLFTYHNCMHNFFTKISTYNSQFFFISFTCYLLYYSFLQFVHIPENLDKNDTSLIKKYQLGGVLGKDLKPFDVVSCAIQVSFSYTQVYFTVYLIFFLGFIGIVTFFALKDFCEKRKRTNLVKDLETLLEEVYMEQESLKNFYEKNRDFLEHQDLMETELRVFRDQFSVEFQNCKNKHFSECSICVESFEDEDKVVPYPGCDHNYHYECLKLWIKSNKTCPLCKGKFRENFVDALCLKLDSNFMRVSERNSIQELRGE